MRMRKFYVVGNLKMNMLSREEVDQYISVLKRESKGRVYKHVQGIVCPSSIYLEAFEHLPTGIERGAQNVFWEKNGAYTGEISPVMLKNAGVNYVIIGHSERRALLGETDEIVKLKTLSALKNLLTPIVCIGETREERDAEKTSRVLEDQVRNIFAGLSRIQAEKIIIAYEPRWAIGSDMLPTSHELLQVRVLLRKVLQDEFDVETAERISVLYGGSVKSSFLGDVTWESQMDGVLVGRESLFPFEVIKMMNMLEEKASEKQTE